MNPLAHSAERIEMAKRLFSAAPNHAAPITLSRGFISSKIKSSTLTRHPMETGDQSGIHQGRFRPHAGMTDKKPHLQLNTIMRRVFSIGFLLSSFSFVAGCAVNGQRQDYRPKVWTEKERQAALFRAEAQYQRTGKVTDGRLAYIDPNARIKLKPTPGSETIYEEGRETLSSMPGGGYFAFVSQVPITRYFTILRRADCDEWGTYHPINPQVMRNNPELLLGSNKFRGDKPWFSCFPAFDDYYIKGNAMLKDADGALFDVDSTRIDQNAIHWTLTMNQVKIHMDGWAIKFADPTPEQITQRLRSIPSYRSAIEQLQFKTVIYWIEANKATQYVEPMLALLPTRDPERSPLYWETQDQFILHALAKIAADTIPMDFWMGVIEKGIHPSISPSYPVSGKVGLAPQIAANVIVCRKGDKKDLVPRLTAVITGTYPLEHKQAAATALRTMGFADVVKNSSGRSDLPLWRATSGSAIYTCPFRSSTDAT